MMTVLNTNQSYANDLSVSNPPSGTIGLQQHLQVVDEKADGKEYTCVAVRPDFV